MCTHTIIQYNAITINLLFNTVGGCEDCGSSQERTTALVCITVGICHKHKCLVRERVGDGDLSTNNPIF